jgi:anti-anti-sigma regulatory factor
MADSAEGKVVSLPAIVDLDALDVVRDGLIDAVELGNTEIDASKVERVATNALFMLISAAETARRNSFAFSITGTSAPMLAAIDRLGLSGSFTGLMKGQQAHARSDG